MISPYVLRLLHTLPPEVAHDLAIMALKYHLLPPAIVAPHAVLRTSLWGKTFPNPVGLAAGFDKNAACIPALLAQGFGFVEVGTVTPLPQIGNLKPRLFRLAEDKAIINRMGFNNKGGELFAKCLARPRSGIVGANIGKNKASTNAVQDYNTLLHKLYGLSDYITINISSPNTPGLRALQGRDELDKLLSVLFEERVKLAALHHKTIPFVVKIAPDMTSAEREAVALVALKHQVDGLIVSNTTVGEREALKSSHKYQAGGLSGNPLFTLSTGVLKEIYSLTEGKIPLIGVGGISSGADAYAKIRAGASLVQLYSAVIFEGFGVVGKITSELAALLEQDGFAHVSEAVGVDVR